MKLSEHISLINRDDVIFFFISLAFCGFPIGTAAPIIPFVCACLAYIASGKICDSRIYREKWFWPALLFIALPWIGLFLSKDLDLGLDYALKTKYWLAAFVMSSVMLNQKRLMILLCLFWGSLFCGSVLALLQYLQLMPVPESGFYGFGIVYTVLSMYLIIGILMAAYSYKHRSNRWEKAGLIFLIVAFLFHISILNGRNGYLVLLIVSPFIANDLTKSLPALSKIVVLAVIMGALSLSPVVQNRIKMTLDHLNRKEVIWEGKPDAEFPRPFIYNQTLKLISQNPVWGIGTGSLRYYTRSFVTAVNHPHNNILYMTVSFGVLGLVAVLWLFGTMFVIAWKKRSSPIGYLVLSICSVIFLGGIFDTLIINAGTCLLLPMGYGMLNHLASETMM